MAQKVSSLLSYVIDYLTEEQQRALTGENPNAIEFINNEQIKEMVEDAMAAYQGGAR